MTGRRLGGAFALVGAGLVACSVTGTGGTAIPDAGADGALEVDSGAGDAPVEPAEAEARDASREAALADALAGECGQHGRQAACTNCCVTAHNDGAGAYLFAVAECMCVPARCEKECATTFCAAEPKEPDAACNTCVTAKTGECTAQIRATCMAEPDCVAFDTCMGESGCTSKP